jgi:hypothetical protein
MNGPDLPGGKRPEPEDTLTAEEHLHAAFQEIRDAKEALRNRYTPLNLIRKNPIAAAGAGLAGAWILKRLFRGGRRARRSGEGEAADTSVGGTFLHSLLVGVARNAGRVLPGILLYWLARRYGFHLPKFGRGGMHGFDDAPERR